MEASRLGKWRAVGFTPLRPPPSQAQIWANRAAEKAAAKAAAEVVEAETAVSKVGTAEPLFNPECALLLFVCSHEQSIVVCTRLLLLPGSHGL